MTELIETGKGSYLMMVNGEVNEGRELDNFRMVLNQAQLCTKDTLVVDLSRVDFFTGSALSLLYDTRAEMERAGKKLILVPGEFVGQFLTRVGWIHRFSTAESVGEAVWHPEMAATA